MEIGAPSLLSIMGGPSLVGISWTSPSTTQTESALLVTTTHSSVQIHSADDQRVVCSWLTRPGSGIRFTVPTVQHRVWRRLYAVQDGRRLLSWSEREASLDQALRTSLRGDAFALRVSKHTPALVVVYADGGVSVFSERHKELFSAPGVTDGSRATWTRLTSLPSHPSTCVLMVVTQAPTAGAGGAGAAPVPLPCLRVFTLSTPASASPDTPVLLSHVATHPLPLPLALAREPLAMPPPCVTAVTLHKHLAQLGLVWSTGELVMLQFTRGPQWFASAPKEVLSRHLVAVVPPEAPQQSGASGSLSSSSFTSTSTSNKTSKKGVVSAAGAERANFHCAAFALEPSCVVLSGANGAGGIGISVWDVRYGVLLGGRFNLFEMGEDSGAAAGAGAGGGREGDDSSPAAAGASSARGKRAAAGQDAPSAPPAALPPSPLLQQNLPFQVTVAENGSCVAVVSSKRVSVIPVAVRGASLASALGRMKHSAPLLLQPPPSSSTPPTFPSLSLSPPAASLEQCIAASLGGAGGGASQPPSRAPPFHADAWRAAVDVSQGPTLKACCAVVDAKATPTPKALAALVFGEQPPAAASGARGAAAGAPPSPALLDALAQRLLRELEAGVGAPAHAVEFYALAGRLIALGGARGVQVSTRFVEALLALAVLPSSSSSGGGDGLEAAKGALALLSGMLRVGGGACDISESSLVRIFSCLVNGISSAALVGVWGGAGQWGGSAGGGSAGKRKREAQPPPPALAERPSPALALLSFTGLLVGAPRNDVFMEKALRALSLQEVTLLLGCLVRLVRQHGSASLGWAPLGAAPAAAGAAALPAPPPLPAVLDWLRLTIDAHYPSLVLEGQLQASRCARRKVAVPQESLLGLLKTASKLLAAQATLADAAAGLQGQLEHVINRLPLPRAPAPEYTVEVLRF